MTNDNCPEKERLEVLVTDIKCFQCRKKFLTQSLFEWHGCFLKSKGNCSKCGKYYPKKKALFIHYVLCEGKFVAPVDPDDALTIKIEKVEAAKKTKARTVPMRTVKSTNIIKKELDLEEDDEYLNYEEDIMHDDDDYEDSNLGVSDRSGASTPANVLEPQIELQEKVAPLRIKLEKMSAGYGDTVQETIPTIPIDPKIIRNIKKEKTLLVKTALTQQQKNLWQLKIKQEKGASTAVTVLNPMALNKNNPNINDTQQKLYKIPQGLALKIKREKLDSGYGDKSNGYVEERDEAEGEDEEFLNPDIVQIKKEKFDPGYVDKTVPKAADNKPNNMRINPLAFMREKKLADANQSSIDDRVNSPGASSSSSSQPPLIISHVTSIPNVMIESHQEPDSEEQENMDTNPPMNGIIDSQSIVDEIQSNSKSKIIIKPTIQIKQEMNNEEIRMDCSNQGESSSSLPGDLLMEGSSMVQIPNEFNIGADEESQDSNMNTEVIEKPNQTDLPPTIEDPLTNQIEKQSNVSVVESDELENAVLNGFNEEFNQPVIVNDAELTLEELLNFD